MSHVNQQGPVHTQVPPALFARNVQKLTRYQTFLNPRDMNAGGEIPFASVELLNLLYILHENEVILARLALGVFYITHSFNVVGTHREHDARKFPRGFVLLVVLGVEL
jgi:hypothetical protein